MNHVSKKMELEICIAMGSTIKKGVETLKLGE